MPALSRFLRYFMVVARLGSIRRAAEELNVSASAIDRQILKAERELGAPLFERRPSGLRLTAAGETMMSAGMQWQKSLKDTLSRIEDLRGLRRGHVEIAVIEALSLGFLPRLIAATRSEFPGISTGLRVLDNDAVYAAITDGTVDFGIMLDPPPSRHLVVRARREVVLGFVTRPDHPLATQPARRYAEGAGYPMVMPAEPLALCRQVAALDTARGSAGVAASADNVQIIKSLVKEGVGIGVLSSIDAASEVDDGALAFVRLTDSVAKPLQLALCVTATRQLSVAANLVLGKLEEAFDMFAA